MMRSSIWWIIHVWDSWLVACNIELFLEASKASQRHHRRGSFGFSELIASHHSTHQPPFASFVSQQNCTLPVLPLTDLGQSNPSLHCDLAPSPAAKNCLVGEVTKAAHTSLPEQRSGSVHYSTTLTNPYWRWKHMLVSMGVISRGEMSEWLNTLKRLHASYWPHIGRRTIFSTAPSSHHFPLKLLHQDLRHGVCLHCKHIKSQMDKLQCTISIL
jgi:hypothetical protein